MRHVVRALELAAVGMGWLMVGITAVLVVPAIPFALAAAWLLCRADDLEAGWRRGRMQNWLWSWAHRHKGYP